MSQSQPATSCGCHSLSCPIFYHIKILSTNKRFHESMNPKKSRKFELIHQLLAFEKKTKPEGNSAGDLQAGDKKVDFESPASPYLVPCLKLQTPSNHPTLPQPHNRQLAQPTPTIASRGGNPQHVCNVVESASDDTWRPAWARPFAAVWIGTSVPFRVSFRIHRYTVGPFVSSLISRPML